MKFMSTKRIALDMTPHFAASQLGLFYLPMSHKIKGLLVAEAILFHLWRTNDGSGKDTLTGLL